MIRQVKRIQVGARQFIQRNIIRRRSDHGMYYAFHGSGRANIGDSMNPWLVGQIAGRTLPYANPRSTRGPNLLAIGSILQFCNDDSAIWGSGFIRRDSKVRLRPRSIHGVRGPLTLKRLKQLGIDADVPFFDAAILASRYIAPSAPASEDHIGIIMHYADDHLFETSALARHKHAVKISVETDDVHRFAAELSRCHVVVSTSLHGIILAEAFGRPALWATCSDNVIGNGFKFHDYYAASGRERETVQYSELGEQHLARAIRLPDHALQRMQNDALEAFPQAFMAGRGE